MKIINTSPYLHYGHDGFKIQQNSKLMKITQTLITYTMALLMHKAIQSFCCGFQSFKIPLVHEVKNDVFSPRSLACLTMQSL
jgi:hypothetical protein